LGWVKAHEGGGMGGRGLKSKGSGAQRCHLL